MGSSSSENGQDDVLSDKINEWLQLTRTSQGHLKAGDYMEALIPHLQLHSVSPKARPPRVTFSYTVQPDHCNRMRNLHGGAAATLYDYCTTLVLVSVSRPGFWNYLGVSRSLNVTYLRPAPCDEEVLIECHLLQVGKRLATLTGTMRRKSDGEILSTCEHGKANIDPDAKL
ncbi:Acyl-coenzyme A thioesterase 13 [Ophiocordyceps camponoti-floridani]|uniref:Acyl-coenzyme A thioesterase 13 n=1 Tax=Ophiocordyceps camponoti-floridani TaxID=2030778 RepID=A0A8H4QBD4_9HYPO|nr:Acyl-coenzyme A thioesterase 13 [Ophiocordyceps camponoti-floridani]